MHVHEYVHTHVHSRTHKHTHIHIYIYTYTLQLKEMLAMEGQDQELTAQQYQQHAVHSLLVNAVAWQSAALGTALAHTHTHTHTHTYKKHAAYTFAHTPIAYAASKIAHTRNQKALTCTQHAHLQNRHQRTKQSKQHTRTDKFLVRQVGATYVQQTHSYANRGIYGKAFLYMHWLCLYICTRTQGKV
jgi:hypothetical protein